MTKKTLESTKPEDTRNLGYQIGAKITPGSIISLVGDLGVGKTVFTQGLAEGLGITEIVNSPTFTLIQIYESGRLPLYHFDVYRIGDESEMDELGYEEYFYGDGVCLVEWANLIEDLMPPQTITIEIAKDLNKGFDYRTITITGMVEGLE